MAQQQKTTTKNLQRLLDAGISQDTICQELGVSYSCVRKWVASGEMSNLGSIACEALLRRSGKGKAISEQFALITFEASQCAQVKAVLSAIGCKFYKLDAEQE